MVGLKDIADIFNQARQIPPLVEFAFWDTNGRGLAARFWVKETDSKGALTGKEYLKPVMTYELREILKNPGFSDEERAMVEELISQIPVFEGHFHDPQAEERYKEKERALIESTVSVRNALTRPDGQINESRLSMSP
jgi:hypothetical protein